MNSNRVFHPWLVVNQNGLFQNQAAWTIENTAGFTCSDGSIYAQPKKHKTKGVVFIFHVNWSQQTNNEDILRFVRTCLNAHERKMNRRVSQNKTRIGFYYESRFNLEWSHVK